MSQGQQREEAEVMESIYSPLLRVERSPANRSSSKEIGWRGGLTSLAFRNVLANLNCLFLEEGETVMRRE